MRKESRKIKGGGCGGAADYGVYVWGTNQTGGGHEGNLIQPVHDPRLFGQPVPQGTPGITGGSRKVKVKGGSPGSTISPASINAGSLLDQNQISELAKQSATIQMADMTKQVPGGVSTDSANPVVTGGKNKRRTKKKIYTKNKRHNGRRKRRTSKIR